MAQEFLVCGAPAAARSEACDNEGPKSPVGFASARRSSFSSDRKEELTLQPTVPCPQREVHLKQYHDAVRAYRQAVAGLNAGLAHHEFKAAHRRAERTRDDFERAHRELEVHVSTHGCQSSCESLIEESNGTKPGTHN